MSKTFVDRVEQIILARIQEEKFGVGDLAKELGLSRSQILRKIKSETGKSVNKFIREIRLREGAQLLKDDELTASEVAYRVGFSSPSYFNKCFLDQYKVTPGEYKKNPEGSEIYTDNAVEPGKRWSNRKTMSSVVLLIIIVLAGYFTVVLNGDDATEYSKASIAVLPLLDLSENKDKEYLTDGITEAIILELAGNESIRVISRSSAMRYKGEKKLSSEIARELGVDLLLEGSVLYAEDTLRVVVQLIEPFPKEKHIWQNSYDQNHSNILELVQEVSHEIANEISSVVEPVSVQQAYVANPEAFDLYLRGRHLWNTQNISKEALLKAVDYLEQAISIEPGFAQAYVTLAETYISINTLIGDNEEKLFYREKAKVAIDRALEIDETLAEAYITKGNIAGKFNWDWEAMKRSAEKALQLEPSNANAHHTLSDYFVITGNIDKAIDEALIAESLDPINPQVECMVAERYYIAEDFDASIRKLLEVIDLNPNYGFAYNNIGFVYFKAGYPDKAIDAWQKLQLIMNNQALYDCYDEHPYQYCFNFFLENAKRNEPRFCSNPVIIASVLMLMDDEKSALEFLDIALLYRNEDLPIMLTYPDFYSLYSNSEFQAIAEQVGVQLPH